MFKLLSLRFVFFFVAISFSSLASAKLKYVFYLIGDGMGVAQRQLAEYYLQETGPFIPGAPKAQLLMNKLPVAGIITTHAANTLVTDSAAAGTALATGEKTNNHTIALDPQGKRLTTLLESLQKKHWKTGIVTTTRITHATPAVFMSHVPDREDELTIAVQVSKAQVDFLAGGGLGNFTPKNGNLKSRRQDDLDLITTMKQQGYEIFSGEEDSQRFLATDFTKIPKAMALFASSHLPYELDRLRTNSPVPTLAQIVGKAIIALASHQQSFFLMVEGGRIDHACHNNDPAAMIQEVLAFDQALAQAYNFYQQHPTETLIIVVADHETGGLGLGIGKEYLLSPSALRPITGSIEELVKEFDINKNQTFFQQLSQSYGLADISSQEHESLEKSLQATNVAMKQQEPYKMSPTQTAVSQVISTRARVNWTTSVHTAAPIPLSAVGVAAEKFGGYHDNTDVAKMLAQLLSIKIGKQ